MIAHLRRCGGICGDSLKEIRGIIGGDVTAHLLVQCNENFG